MADSDKSKGPRNGVGNGADEDIDPRLDNRGGDQRPELGEIVPQQIHGGQPGDDTDYEDPPSADVKSLGHRSVGPHGRGPQSGPSSED